MKLTYKRQLILTVVIVLLFNILTTVCRHWGFLQHRQVPLRLAVDRPSGDDSQCCHVKAGEAPYSAGRWCDDPLGSIQQVLFLLSSYGEAAFGRLLCFLG